EGTHDRIVAPKLRKLHMHGRWAFQDQNVMAEFVGGMFPKLQRLTARAWSGVSIGSFVNAIRTTAGYIEGITTLLE
ncbi:hypothetical protein BGZ96_003393, partial [Linnemannia gamsii]